MKMRNSGIELARIILIICTLFMHYNNSAYAFVSSSSAKYYWLLLCSSFSCGCVNYFVMVSGLYLSSNNERKLIKVVEIVLQAVLFNICFYLGSIMLGQNSFTLNGFASRMIPKNWFIVLYSCLYVISPYINLLTNRLSDREFKKLIVIVFFLFSVLSYLNDLLVMVMGSAFLSINPIGYSGSQAGCGIVNFVLLYLIGSFIARDTIKIRKRVLISALITDVIIMFTISLLLNEGNLLVAWENNSPFNIVFVAIVILLLKDCSFKNGTINELSKATFTFYLFHSNFMTYIGIEWAARLPLPVMIAHELTSGMALFLISYFVYRVYNICTAGLIRWLSPLCNKIDLSLNKELGR